MVPTSTDDNAAARRFSAPNQVPNFGRRALASGDMRTSTLGILGCLAVGLVAWGEWVNWRASRTLVGPDRGGTEVIICLGFRNRDPRRANPINRWRVRAALRSIDPAAPRTTVIFSGGSGFVGATSEAEPMARYAREELGHGGEIVLEDQSRSTWQNVELSLPLIGDPDRIKIVSNPLHALKGRLYLQRQSPRLAARLVPGQDYRLGEWAVLKPVFAGYGLRTLWIARPRACPRAGGEARSEGFVP